MSRRTKGKLLIIGLATGVLVVVGILYALVFNRPVRGGISVGVLVGLSTMSFEMFVVQGRHGSRLRRAPFWLYALISGALWSVLALAGITISQHIFNAPEDVPDLFSYRTMRAFAVVITVLGGVNFFVRIAQLIGGRILFNIILGRYNRPIKEDRIFLFLDLTDSVQITTLLGPRRTHSAISRFFFDVQGIVMEYGGETHRYVGDETVITWSTKSGVENAAWLHCILAIRDYAETTSYFQANFGITLAFRAGLHCGRVVAGEVGDNKREIVYFGDTINTAARLESLCKTMNETIIVSGDLIGATDMPDDVAVESIGPVALKGRPEPVEIFRVYRLN